MRLPPPYPRGPRQRRCLPPHQPLPRRLHGRRHLPCRIRRRPIFLLQRRHLSQAFSVPRRPPLSLRLPRFSPASVIHSTPISPNFLLSTYTSVTSCWRFRSGPWSHKELCKPWSNKQPQNDIGLALY